MQSKEDERKQAPWKCGNEKCNYLRSRSITGYFQEHLPSLKVQFPEVIIFPTFAGEIPECIFEEKFWETFLKRGYLDQIKRSMSVPVLLCGISPMFQKQFYDLIFPLKDIFYGKYIRMCPNLGCCFMQGGEFPEVRYVDTWYISRWRHDYTVYVYLIRILCIDIETTEIWYVVVLWPGSCDSRPSLKRSSFLIAPSCKDSPYKALRNNIRQNPTERQPSWSQKGSTIPGICSNHE